jgi:predicted branched-subunit amino acid permease
MNRTLGALDTHREDILRGMRDGAPAALGTVPYGLVLGIAAVSIGLTLPQATGLAAFVFAGLASLTMVDLLGGGASIAVAIAAALIVNFRFTMYSASIAPHLEELGRVWRWTLPFFLVGPVYAIALNAYERGRADHHGWYFLGVAIPSWTVWVVGTVVGVVVGAGVPESLQLGFAVPLIFIAIIVRFLEDVPTVLAAVAGGGGAVAVVDLPFNLGLLVGAAVGILVGFAAQAVRG